MDENTTSEEKDGLRNSLGLPRSVSDKHLDLSRVVPRVMAGQVGDGGEHKKGKYTLLKDVEDFQTGIYDKPLPCFGCGIGWFSFLLEFEFPLIWYCATFLYFGNYYLKDPRERAGLATSAVTAMAFSLVLLVIVFVLMI